jgi:PAS domain S-box-containing protein
VSIAIGEDLPNQKLVRVLELSKALTDGILDELPVSVILIDGKGKILKLNEVCCGLFGRDEAKLLGCSLFELLPIDSSAKKEFAAYLAAPPTDAAVGFEDKWLQGDRTVHTLWQLCPIYAVGGTTVHVAIGSDITDSRVAITKLISLTKEMEVAAAVQSVLMPKSAVVETKSLILAASYSPAAQVGGDWWWHCPIGEDRTLTIVSDVSGHGVGSAMVTAMLAGAVDSMLHRADPKSFQLEPFLKEIDTQVTRLCGSVHSISLACVETRAGCEKIRVASAGLPVPYIMRKDGKCERINAYGNPFGYGGDNQLEIVDTTLAPGERVMVYTDGVYEDQNIRRGVLIPQLLTVVRELPPPEACVTIAKFLAEMRGTPVPEDDVTFVILERR